MGNIFAIAIKKMENILSKTVNFFQHLVQNKFLGQKLKTLNIFQETSEKTNTDKVVKPNRIFVVYHQPPLCKLLLYNIFRNSREVIPVGGAEFILRGALYHIFCPQKICYHKKVFHSSAVVFFVQNMG